MNTSRHRFGSLVQSLTGEREASSESLRATYEGVGESGVLVLSSRARAAGVGAVALAALLGTSLAWGQGAPKPPPGPGAGPPAPPAASASASAPALPTASAALPGLPPAPPPQATPLWPPTAQAPASGPGFPSPEAPPVRPPHARHFGHGPEGSHAAHYPRIETHIDLHNLFLNRGDSDFDRSKPAYDKNGQSVGAFATVFRPKLTFHIQENLRLYYEAELGLNFWSKNNPDQQSALASDVFVLKHREIYSEGEFLQGTTGFKAGYQYFRDTTALFVGHWIGAASAWYSWGSSGRASVFVGQIPDLTYEGLNANDNSVLHNNFKNDIFIFGPRTDLKLGQNASFAAAVHVLYDSHIVDQTQWLVAPNMQIEGKSGPYSGFLGGVLQVGKHLNAGLGGQDQNIFAWAAQAHGNANLEPVELALNVLALSPDDQSEGNSRNGAFRYSSKSKSATIILTEDELRNWYDQLDRRLGRYEGGFWTHRAGLFVGDVKGTWVVTKVFRPGVVLGAASVLNKKNAMDKSFVGVETDLDLEFRASENLVGHLVGGLLIPGAAGGSLLNKINMQATDPIWMIEGSLLARY